MHCDRDQAKVCTQKATRECFHKTLHFIEFETKQGMRCVFLGKVFMHQDDQHRIFLPLSVEVEVYLLQTTTKQQQATFLIFLCPTES